MKVIIDNSGENKTCFYFKTGSRWTEKCFAPGRRSILLDRFVEALKQNRKTLDNLSGIAVVVGRGRFTATRIAVTLANALAFAKKIPAIGLRAVDFAAAEKGFKKAKRGVYLSALYSGDAHISGKPSKSI